MSAVTLRYQTYTDACLPACCWRCKSRLHVPTPIQPSPVHAGDDVSPQDTGSSALNGCHVVVGLHNSQSRGSHILFLLQYVCVCVCVYMSVCVSVYMSVCTRDMCVCVCVRGDGINLKYAVRWHIHISVHSVLRQCYTQALAHMHPQTI